MKDTRAMFEQWVRRNRPMVLLTRSPNDEFPHDDRSEKFVYSDPAVQEAWMSFAAGWAFRAVQECLQ